MVTGCVMGERINEIGALRLSGERIDRLRQVAHQARCRHYPDGRASYIIMRIVSYTNVCVADCSYCAFYRRPGDREAYVLSNEQIFEKIDDLKKVGGSVVAMEGGFNPKLRIDHYENLFRAIPSKFMARRLSR